MKVDGYKIGLSKRLRKTSTPWERKLWYYLRGGRFSGLKFKRQVPIGNYIVDFCCHEKRLVIELDGGGHSEQQQHVHDLEKDNYLEQEGYQILRFWNIDVDKNIEGILHTIKGVVT